MKKYIIFVIILIFMFILPGCNNRNMNYIIENEPSITGIVKEVRDNSILMYIETESYANGSDVNVSLDVENTDSYTDVSVGDEVVVYYNGDIAESDPLQINTVYAITLKTPAKADSKWDVIPMVMIDGKLYYDTGKESSIDGRCGMMDGEITSTVEGSETPTVDNQSNFGTGFGYQYGADNTIEIFMNEKWIVFEHRVGNGSQVRFGDRWVDKDSLSEETLEWLSWFNSLSKEEQLAVSAIPSDLLDSSGISATEDAEAISY